MIYCNLKGGLGNMLFQIAAAKSIAIDTNNDCSFPNLVSHLQYLDSDGVYNQLPIAIGGAQIGNPLLVVNERLPKNINNSYRFVGREVLYHKPISNLYNNISHLYFQQIVLLH